MEEKYSQIRGAGLGLAAVSYDSPAVLKAFADRMHIEFPLLSDQDSAVIRRFGIFNEAVPKNNPTYGIPNPGVYVIDAQGVVQAKYFENDFKQRDTAGMILLKQFGLAPEKPQTSVAAKHLNIQLSATETDVHMGQHVSLILDAELPPDVHVYAPGVKGYIAIDWEMPDTAAVQAGPVTYPSSKMLRLEAIQETVPVYTGHLRLVRDITIKSFKGTDLVVAGTFRYQACDAQKCFIPETVPLTTTLHFEPLDMTRAPEDLRRK